MSRVSILLPARNASGTIDLAVRSLLTQTFTDFELIAIDDGSSDDTFARLRAHAFSRGAALHEVAADVVARRLRLDGDDR